MHTEMSPEIESKLDELRDLCQSHYPDDTIVVKFHLTSMGWEDQILDKPVEMLIESGNNMKNIKGEWIKEED